jgi:hypothetical protein
VSELDDWTYTVETVRREDVEPLLALLALPVRELVIDWPDDDPPIPQPKVET